MSRKNKNNMNNINIKGNENNITAEKITQKQNRQSNIDKSKTIIKESKPGKFDPEYIMFWANPFNDDALLYKRLPHVNDRPMLEKYYTALVEPEKEESKPIIFYAYVASKRSNKAYTLLNVVSEHGNLMTPHLIAFNESLDIHQYQVIKFKGVIRQYNKNKEGEEIKYEIKIVDEHEIEVMSGRKNNYSSTSWELLYNRKPNEYIDPREMFSKYNMFTIEEKMKNLDHIIDFLNDLSWDMFNVPNMIAPLALSTFLMREDIYNKAIVLKNHTHMNVVLTMIADYIVNIKPRTYYHTMCIVYYVVFNYLGYDLENPSNKERFYEMVDILGVARSNADHYINNAKNNCGGIENLKRHIPCDFKTESGKIHAAAGFQFAKRIYYNC